jgi:hypothetical protein
MQDAQQRLESLKQEADRKVRDGNVHGGLVTNFPKNPPPSGIEYSKNFARFQKDGRFAIQVKD